MPITNPAGPAAADFAATAEGFSLYACPSCKGDLALLEGGLRCPVCQITYPLLDGIPDFMPADIHRDANQIIRNVARVDRLARVYESRWWYPLVLSVYAGWRKTLLPEMVRVVGEMIRTDGRLILDAACGPGTLGRRIVSPDQALYGADISWGMLRTGQDYARWRASWPNERIGRASTSWSPTCITPTRMCGATASRRCTRSAT